MIPGVLFVIAACSCWGLIFVIPKFSPEFSSVEISLGRFFFFGIISLAILLLKKRHLIQRSFLPAWGKALYLSLVATLISYTCVVFSVRYANSAIAALIFGMSPITIPLAGNLYKKEFSFGKFLVPGLLMILGIVLTNLTAFDLGDVDITMLLFGLICGFAGLGFWTWYSISHFHYLEKNRQLPANDWVIMMGTATLGLVMVTIGILVCITPDLSKYRTLSNELVQFLTGSFVLGAVSTWLGFLFWAYGNRRLSISLAGQLTVFEMIFGLLYVYMVEQRLPLPLEISGILLMLVGVLAALKTLKKVSTQQIL